MPKDEKPVPATRHLSREQVKNGLMSKFLGIVESTYSDRTGLVIILKPGHEDELREYM